MTKPAPQYSLDTFNWCFATVNNKLAEIFFEKSKGDPKILGHTYVKISEYKTKKELTWIKKETLKFQLTYKNKKYHRVQI